SFDGERRWSNVESAQDYAGGARLTEQTLADPVGERFFLGLRLSRGINVREGDWHPFEGAIRRRLREGLLEYDGGRLRLTNRGVMLSNEVFTDFIGVSV